jgi:hypothetical protein
MYKYILCFAVSVLGCNGAPIVSHDAGTTDNPVDAGVGNVDVAVDAGTNPVPIDSGIDTGSGASSHCGDSDQSKCLLGEACRRTNDCASEACNYQGKCIEYKSCVNRFGGDTCGAGEVGSLNAQHESCCRSLPVVGYNDPYHPGKKVYVDKYEITAGRVRAFVNAINSIPGGIRQSLAINPPAIWNAEWNKFLPADKNDSIVINRMLLGDPRHDGQTQEQAGPGVIVPPTTDQAANLGIEYQFGAQVYADVHGNNCGVFPGSYGFPTYYYPPSVLTRNNEFPRSAAISDNGSIIPAQEVLDVKSMNCITNAMLVAFCAWDGGQLATSEVLDFITETPPSLGNDSGCGTQVDYHGVILDSSHVLPDPNIRSGGKCPNLSVINATFDAGGKLPSVWTGGFESPDPLYNSGNFLNWNLYSYPNFPAADTSQKTWQVEAPGRMPADNIDGWMDLAGNLSEAVLETNGGSFTGRFGLKYRGVGYGSARSDLNVTLMPNETILRVQRPEVKTALAGGRCMKFK